MTVRAWKRLISGIVVILILGQSCALIYLLKKYEEYIDNNKEYLEYIAEAKQKDIGFEHLNFALDYLETTNAKQNQEILAYQSLYDNLYVNNDYTYELLYDKKVYLTFDDGPTPGYTDKILDILKENEVKATFFVIYKEGEDVSALYKRIVEEGHTIGVHSASHQYKKIYSSVEAYLEDFAIMEEKIFETTGVKPEIFRFPGGSINSYNGSTYIQIIAEMTRRGYTYYDWNVSSGDASQTKMTERQIVDNILGGIRESKANVVLMHDSYGKNSTVNALPEVISRLKEDGYTVEALNRHIMAPQFGYLE